MLGAYFSLLVYGLPAIPLAGCPALSRVSMGFTDYWLTIKCDF